MDELRPLGHVGVHLERPARARRARGVAGRPFPRSSAGHGGARRHSRRHRRQRTRALGRRPGRRRPARDRDPVLPHRRAVPTIHRGARQAARPHRRRAQPVVPRPERDAAVQLRPRPFRLPRPAVAAGDEGLRRGADAGLRRCAGTGRVHPRLSRRERAGRRICRSPRCCHATAATWPTGGCRSTSAAFRDYLRENADTPEEQELLAAKFMGRWRSGAPLVLAPGQGRSRAGRRSDAQQRLQLQGDGPVRLRVPAGIPCPPAQSARHRPQHEPPPDDPPRRDLRTRPARRRARRRRGPRHRRVHHLRRPGPPVRVRPERLDQRQDASTNSATSTTRSAGPRTAHWISPSRSGRSARCTRECRPSPR